MTLDSDTAIDRDDVTTHERPSVKLPEVPDGSKENVGRLSSKSREQLTHAATPFKSEVLTSAELTPELVAEIARFYRYVFNNEKGHFLVFPEAGEFVHPRVMIPGPEDEYVDLDVMDSLDPQSFPAHNKTGERAVLHHDPDMTVQRLHEKLDEDGYVSLIRDHSTEEIVGFTLGYGGGLEKLFRNEWGNKYLYAADQPSKHDRDFNSFLSLLRQTWGDESLNSDSEVFCWNCVATTAQAHRAKQMGPLMQQFFAAIPPKTFRKDLYVIGEVEKGTRAHEIFKALGTKEVPGVLEGKDTVISGRLNTVAQRFNLSPEAFASIKAAANK